MPVDIKAREADDSRIAIRCTGGFLGLRCTDLDRILPFFRPVRGL